VTGPDEQGVNDAIKDIGTKFNITHQAKVKDFLGVKVDKDTDSNMITFSQPHLINSILKDVGLEDNSNPRITPAVTSNILHKFIGSAPH
jgi:hypothetical protein